MDTINDISASGKYGCISEVLCYSCIGLGIFVTYFSVWGLIGMFSGVMFKLTVMLAIVFNESTWTAILLWSTVGGFGLGICFGPYICCLTCSKWTTT